MFDPNEDFDLRQLAARGWTRRMVHTLLGKEDYRIPVDHYRNFSGKMIFARWRVEAAEATEKFRNIFLLLQRYRRLPQSFVDETMNRSLALETAGAEWKGPPPMSETELNAAHIATFLKLARMGGFRTPHKC